MVEGALALAADGGLAAVTLNAVCEASETSNGAVYHLFGNRVGLLGAAHQVLLARVQSSIEAALEYALQLSDPREAVAAIVTGYIDTFTAQNRLLRAFLVEGNDVPELRERGDRVGFAIDDSVSQALQRITGCSTERASTSVYMILSVATTHMLFGGARFMKSPPSTSELAAHMSDAICEKLTL
jgi:AcrR family transcriptional regulator